MASGSSNFDDNTILVTGASAGIGEAVAIALADFPCRLVLVGRDLPRLERVAEECRQRQALSADPVACDLSDSTAASGLIDGIVKTHGGAPHALIHCAGTAPRGFAEDVPLTVVGECLNVNALAFLALCQDLIPPMKTRKAGAILAVTSGHAQIGMRGFSAYSAAKSALERICEALDDELSAYGILVTLLSPGAVATSSMLSQSSYSASLPLRKVTHLREPREVAMAVLQAIQSRKKRVDMGLKSKFLKHMVYWAPGLLRILFAR